MSRESERLLLTQHFKEAVWDPADGPVAYPNHEFETPAKAMFAVFNLVDRGTTRESVGGTYLKKTRGTVQVDIYTPVNQGTRRARQIADRLEGLYDSLIMVTADGEVVNFYTPMARQLAGNEVRAANLDDNWSRYIVEAPYTRQSIVAR